LSLPEIRSGEANRMNPTITNLRCAVVIALVVTTLAVTCTAASAQSSEGIKVHGRWTVEVRNPDGSLASRSEFDNALVVGGQNTVTVGGNSALAGLLGRYLKNIFSWRIELESIATGICSEGTLYCNIEENLDPGPPGMGELTVRTPTQSFLGMEYPSGSVELKGMTQIVIAGRIGKVRTGVQACRDAACGSRLFAQFTSHALPTPIEVVAEQVVQVTVVLTFS
jgi:hypothetical protein